MTDLSVVIVSYNVRAFLEQCLVSVERAMKGLNVDVWVVDNRSVDGSVDMVASKFPWVKLVANEENVGFSKANNQAIRACAGRHILLLNPDTVVREDTFASCLAYVDSHPDVGGMGVPMHDGTGRFLPESKRGLPTPWAALCRMAGLHRLAPNSRRLNAYYAGHVARDETAQVDILSGAFMWLRREALDQVGLLDEQFFMYGEDIDLSWRLVLGGWKNVYFADTDIIHYKGESTKKGSLNYVLVFYRAMLLFAAKHFEGRQAHAFNWMIRLAIYGRAGLAIVRRLLHRWGMPLNVAFLTLAWSFGLLWGINDWFDKGFDWVQVGSQMAILVMLQMAFMWSFGGYREQGSERSVAGQLLAWFATSVLVLGVYSLLPEHWRFSRLAVVGMMLGHGFMHALASIRVWRQSGNPFKTRRLIVAGDDMQDVVNLLRRNQVERVKQQSFGLWPGAELPQNVTHIHGTEWIGCLKDVLEASVIHGVDEVVFSGRDTQATDILDVLPALGQRRIRCRIAWTDAGDLMSSGGASREEFVGFRHGLQRPEVARTKRVFDRASAFMILAVALGLWCTGRRGWGAAAWRVITGQMTWVGSGSFRWPQPAVFELTEGLSPKAASRKAFTHAQDYHWRKDFAVVADALISRRAIFSHGNH